MIYVRVEILAERMENIAKMMESLGETRGEMNTVSKIEELVRGLEAGAKVDIMMPALEAMEDSLGKEMRKRVHGFIARTEEGSRGNQGGSASTSLHTMCYKLKGIALHEPNKFLANRYRVIF